MDNILQDLVLTTLLVKLLKDQNFLLKGYKKMTRLLGNNKKSLVLEIMTHQFI